MKHISLFFIPLFVVLLSGCEKVEEESQLFESLSSSLSFDYSDVELYQINWSEILSKEEDYYAYIYSPTCFHCQEIKQEMLEARILHNINLYYIKYNKDIEIVTERDSLIGIDSVEHLGILGTPSLFEIKNHKTFNYFAGKTEIINTMTNLYKV